MEGGSLRLAASSVRSWARSLVLVSEGAFWVRRCHSGEIAYGLVQTVEGPPLRPGRWAEYCEVSWKGGSVQRWQGVSASLRSRRADLGPLVRKQVVGAVVGPFRRRCRWQ